MVLFFCNSKKTNVALKAALQNNFHLGEMQKGIDISVLGKE